MRLGRWLTFSERHALGRAAQETVWSQIETPIGFWQTYFDRPSASRKMIMNLAHRIATDGWCRQ